MIHMTRTAIGPCPPMAIVNNRVAVAAVTDDDESLTRLSGVGRTLEALWRIKGASLGVRLID